LAINPPAPVCNLNHSGNTDTTVETQEINNLWFTLPGACSSNGRKLALLTSCAGNDCLRSVQAGGVRDICKAIFFAGKAEQLSAGLADRGHVTVELSWAGMADGR
jgi:hypothetical protein